MILGIFNNNNSAELIITVIMKVFVTIDDKTISKNNTTQYYLDFRKVH